MRFLRRSLTGIFLMALTLGLLAYAGGMVFGAVQDRLNAEPRAFTARERVLSVNVVSYVPQSVVPELTVFGETRSRRTLDIRSAAAGNVLRVDPAFVDGGTVTAGQILVWIDPVEAEEALARVQADLADAEAERRDAERGLILARDELAAAEVQAALRAQALQRQRDLQTRGIGTAPDLETAELASSTSAQAVLVSRQAIAQAEARIDQTGTLIARTELNLAEAERALAATELRAAFDGTLSDVTLGPGGRVTANEQVARLVDPGLLEVAFRVSTSQYARLMGEDGALMQAPVTVGLDVSGVSLFAEGRITRESAGVAEGQTGRLLFAQIDATPAFRPGDFVTVRIAEPEMQNVALLPATAVAADETVLVVSEDERLRSAPVTLLRRQADEVIVRAEDLDGALIVAERTPLLGAGIAVRPILPGSMGEAEASDPAPPAEDVAAMVQLSEEHRARLVAYVEGSPTMPVDAKTRILSALAEDEVPADMIARIESRMGS